MKAKDIIRLLKRGGESMSKEDEVKAAGAETERKESREVNEMRVSESETRHGDSSQSPCGRQKTVPMS